ncbi:MAG: AMP-binding protein, partial [Verrucomicrobiota bacterium]|nr:AMP-binding protein [Verrucomicrobiota bacterium]
ENEPAIIDESGGAHVRMTFGEIELAAACVAARLRESGLRPGDSVLVLQPMSADLYIALCAILRLRLVAIFLDPSAGLRHIAACCAVHPPKAFIGSAKAHWLRLLSPALRRIPLKFCTGSPVFGARSLACNGRSTAQCEIEPCAAGTPAIIRFTSGSTGAPKAAVRTHGFLLAQQRVLQRSITLTRGEVDLTTLPMFGLANLAAGVTTVIPSIDLRRPGAIDARLVVEQIQRRGVTRTAGSPAFFEQLATFCERTNRKLEKLEKIYTGGAPVFPGLLRRLQILAPRADVVAVYGSTEAEPIAQVAFRGLLRSDLESTARGGGLVAGRPVEEIQARILRDEWGRPIGPFSRSSFDAQSLPPGEIGEIVVSGSHVLDGYLAGRGDAEIKFRVDGGVWHRTGDAGCFDREGRLWLAGRCAAKVVDSHGVLYPLAAEGAAREFPFVRHCALAGLNGCRVLAVEFAGRATSEHVNQLREALAWAQLSEIRTLPIPVDRRHNAKIDYGELRKRLA